MLIKKYDCEKCTKLGDNINLVMEKIKESSPGCHKINCWNKQQLKALFVISRMILWQQEVNKKVDITISKADGMINIEISDFIKNDNL